MVSQQLRARSYEASPRPADWGGRGCGGALITRQVTTANLREPVVITAAHCTFETDPAKYVIAQGFKAYYSSAASIGRGATWTRRALAVVRHPGWSTKAWSCLGASQGRYDVALILLDKPVTTARIRLPVASTRRPDQGAALLSLGYGQSEPESSTGAYPVASSLQRLDVAVVSPSNCTRTFRCPVAKATAVTRGPGLICAGGQAANSAACRGDSGSPLVRLGTSPASDELVGGGYSWVPFYIPWIKAQLQAWSVALAQLQKWPVACACSLAARLLAAQPAAWGQGRDKDGLAFEGGLAAQQAAAQPAATAATDYSAVTAAHADALDFDLQELQCDSPLDSALLAAFAGADGDELLGPQARGGVAAMAVLGDLGEAQPAAAPHPAEPPSPAPAPALVPGLLTPVALGLQQMALATPPPPAGLPTALAGAALPPGYQFVQGPTLYLDRTTGQLLQLQAANVAASPFLLPTGRLLRHGPALLAAAKVNADNPVVTAIYTAYAAQPFPLASPAAPPACLGAAALPMQWAEQQAPPAHPASPGPSIASSGNQAAAPRAGTPTSGDAPTAFGVTRTPHEAAWTAWGEAAAMPAQAAEGPLLGLRRESQGYLEACAAAAGDEEEEGQPALVPAPAPAAPAAPAAGAGAPLPGGEYLGSFATLDAARRAADLYALKVHGPAQARTNLPLETYADVLPLLADKSTEMLVATLRKDQAVAAAAAIKRAADARAAR
eukprot:scaffold4.g4845.t1